MDASLLLLIVLTVPPFTMAALELMNLLIIGEADTMHGKSAELKNESRYCGENQPNGKAQVYDGMSTVEIPVLVAQKIAYEPISSIAPGYDDEIILLGPISPSN